MTSSSLTRTLFIAVFISYVVYFTANIIFRSRRNSAKAKSLNCADPPLWKNRLPFGIDQVNRALKSLDDKSFPVDLFKKCTELGTFTYGQHLLGKYGIFTADEKNIHAILSTQFADFGVGEARAPNFEPFIGIGIFSQDGQDWERSRALLRPQFAKDNLNDLGMKERHVQILQSILSKSSEPDGWTHTIDLQPLIFRLTLDTATEFLFGTSVNSQQNITAASDMEDFSKCFDKGLEALGTRALYFQFAKWVYPKGFRHAIFVCHMFVDAIVKKALDKRDSGMENVSNIAGGFGERFVFLEALVGKTRDPVQLRSQSMNILLAGRDTTASTIGWLLFELIRHPTKYQKLRDVVVQQFGSYKECIPATDISLAKINSCKYLHHCINEALRLYPAVPYNLRVANYDTTLPRGGGVDGNGKLFVPKGTQVDYSPYVLHRRKDIWGNDADEFVPERWEDRKIGKEFIPFNAGPRVCLGQQYGVTEVAFVILRLLQRFDRMENMDPDLIARHHYSLTTSSANGVKVRLHLASSSE